MPKISISVENLGDRLVQNPRILDLRQKLNEITKKRERDVDKETKTLINDITQQLVDENHEENESGPYSLLLDLQNQESTSKEVTENNKSNVWKDSQVGANEKDINLKQCHMDIVETVSLRTPNVLNLQEKSSTEFEYSCVNYDEHRDVEPKRLSNTSSRSDLCLHFKNQILPKSSHLESPLESSISRMNEENSLDDSLGILTPDQMDDMCYLENAFSPTVENLPIFCGANQELKVSPDNGDSPSTEKTESNSAASAMFMEKDLGNDAIRPMQVDTVLLKPFENNLAGDSDNDVNMADLDDLKKNEGNRKSVISNDDLMMPISVEEDLLRSVHSSILEPISSIVETTTNLELPLDCKLPESNLCLPAQIIEHTPSPEDLPLDASDIHGDLSTCSNSQVSGSTLHESQTYSDSKTDYAKSMETSKVSNSFITSITSITSLDGYQGDGEMSRPVSRGADQSLGNREDIVEMDWQNVPVTRRPDPMTDSDFFTESDADCLDDHMHRGDRRAQVIDGALYGGQNNNGNPPLIVNRGEDSCMESSGVYTDLENQRNSPVLLNAIDDMSPDGSSPSTRSECSQRNGTAGAADDVFEMDDTLVSATKSRLSLLDNTNSSNNSKNESIIVANEKNLDNSKLQKEEKRFTLKKYKMPKRDVPSKLKTMLATRKNDTDSVQSSPKTMKKNDRRESLVKKNPNDIKNDLKTKSYKDIKSKVDCSFSLQRSQTACSVSRMLSAKSTNINTKPKRHMRMRMTDLGSGAGSGKSSLHSSQSDLSASSTPVTKHAPTRFPLTRGTKKRDSVTSQCTRAPGSPPHAVLPPQQPPNAPALAKKNGVVAKLAASPGAVRARQPPPSPRAQPPRRPSTIQPPSRANSLPVKDSGRTTTTNGSAARGGKRASVAPAQPQAAPRPTPLSTPAVLAPEPAAAIAHAAKGVEALGVLVQYLVFRLDALNGNGWRAEATRWRGLASTERSNAARASLDHQQRAQKDLDTISECLNKISELEMEVSAKEDENARLQAAGADAESRYRATLTEIASLASDIKGLKNTIDSLKREVAESRARLHAQGEREKILRSQLDVARRDLARAKRQNSTNDYSSIGDFDATDDSLDSTLDSSAVLSSLDHRLNSTSDDVFERRLGDRTLNGGSTEESYNSQVDLTKDKSELAAEVWSLRAVLEIKQAEACGLRAARSELTEERERRAELERELNSTKHAHEELRERCGARAREAEHLRDDNRRLRETAARDRDRAARLSALAEELRYKLRQKSQVVSLLANGAGGGYCSASASPGCARARSPSPSSPSPPPSPPAASSPRNSSPPPGSPRAPAVKAVVEKQDSVSWVLEIEESPEEVASRLARRSSFRGGSSPANTGGVKRRGGSSPAPPGSPPPTPLSPAPNASKLFRPGDLDYPPQAPPLKESAGEAIYIYDDTRY